MLRNSFFKTIPFLFFIVLFISCDKEFNVIGEDIVGDNSFDIKKEEFPIVGYNQKIDPVQSNNLEINQFGIYSDPSFGTTTATFVTQLIMTSLNPTFDKSATIKSVVLSIPYFSTKTVTNTTDGSSTYVLDSIYGNPEKVKMKLSVYESDYFMRDLDPEEQLTQPQKYYSNQYLDFSQKKIGVALNNDSDKAQNTEFFFDPAEHSVETINADGSKTTTRTPPAMQLNLNKDFFNTKILNAPVGSLVDNTAFKDYFKGLFFDIEAIDANQGNLAMINFKNGKITITYTETTKDTAGKDVVTDKTLVLSLVGNSSVPCNTVNLLSQSNTNQKYIDATKPATDIDKVEGVSSLYLKGGEGSMSVLKIFGDDKFGKDGVSGLPNGVPDKLDIMRENKYLVNQAELTFYLNSDAMGNSHIPQRIYLYDFTNNQILIDYLDNTTTSNAKKNKFVFGGIILKETEANGGGYYYKFRLTNHVRNLVKDIKSTNVDLGLVVTEDINKAAFYSLRDKKSPFEIPMASVMNPLGAIVFGNNIPSDDKNYKKRIKFEIYYTKTN